MSEEKRAALMLIDINGNILEFPDMDCEDFTLVINRVIDVRWKYPDHKLIRFTGKGRVLAEVNEFLIGGDCDGRKV